MNSTIRLLLTATLTCISGSAFGQLAAVSDKQSILGRKVLFTPEGHVRSWYQPDVPGSAFDHVIKLGAEFFLNQSPLDPINKVPLYFTTSCFSKPDLQARVYNGDKWPSNPACIFAGAVETFAIDYYGYTGDANAIHAVAKMLDYQLENGTTPTDFSWSSVPYASADPFAKKYEGSTIWESEQNRGDGLHVIEPDKVGELGLGYLRFYEVTGDKKYLNASLDCADALAAKVRDVTPEASSLGYSNVEKSPWPFRVNARTGVTISEYTSNVLAPVMLFDEALRVKNIIQLSEERAKAFKRARDLAWNWLYSKNGPMKTFIWNGYFEDVPNDPERANRIQLTPGELAKHLIRNPDLEPNSQANAITLLNWIRTVFKEKGWDAINEQTWCYEPMGSHTARYGSAIAMLYERTGDTRYRDEALNYLNYATYMTLDDGFVAVGPNWPGSWWCDGYTDYLRHYSDAIAAVPEWAPEDESHLLRTSSPLQSIKYSDSGIEIKVFENGANMKFKLVRKPVSIEVDGKSLPESSVHAAGAFTWSDTRVLLISAAPGTHVNIRMQTN